MWSLLTVLYELIFFARAIREGRRDGSLRGKQLWITLLDTVLTIAVTLAPLFFLRPDQLQRHIGFLLTWMLTSIVLGVGGMVITLRRINLRKSVAPVNPAVASAKAGQ